MKNPYEDLLNLPHHVSASRPPMPMADRAAQFSPFAALVGYDAAIQETGRLTSRRVEPEEEILRQLNQRFCWLAEHLAQEPEVIFICFRPDERKAGGAYLEIRGQVKKIDELHRTIFLRDGTRLSMDDILELRGEIFHSLEP